MADWFVIPCALSDACVNRSDCDGDQLCCSDNCVDWWKDEENCNGCGSDNPMHVCAPGEVCDFDDTPDLGSPVSCHNDRPLANCLVNGQLLGDVEGDDGIISANDAFLLLQYVTDLPVNPADRPFITARGNVDGRDGITSTDALLIMQFSNETITVWPHPGCSPASPGPCWPLGDVNEDGNVNAIDAALILQFDARIIGFLPNEANGDVNSDNEINSLDAALILQYEAGNISCFGGCPPAICVP